MVSQDYLKQATTYLRRAIFARNDEYNSLQADIEHLRKEKDHLINKKNIWLFSRRNQLNQQQSEIEQKIQATKQNMQSAQNEIQRLERQIRDKSQEASRLVSNGVVEDNRALQAKKREESQLRDKVNALSQELQTQQSTVHVLVTDQNTQSSMLRRELNVEQKNIEKNNQEYERLLREKTDQLQRIGQAKYDLEQKTHEIEQFVFSGSF